MSFLLSNFLNFNTKQKNHTHEKKVGHTSEFLFGIYWWSWKTIICLKKLLKWANKECKNFNIYNVVFFKQNKEKHLEIYFTPVYQKSWWYGPQFLRYRTWQTKIGNFGTFFALLTPLKPWKIRISKKGKNLPEISSFHTSGFELVKQNLLAKNSELREEKVLLQAKRFLDLQMIL